MTYEHILIGSITSDEGGWRTEDARKPRTGTPVQILLSLWAALSLIIPPKILPLTTAALFLCFFPKDPRNILVYLFFTVTSALSLSLFVLVLEEGIFDKIQ